MKMNEDKKNIIISAIIPLVCLLGAIIYLIYGIFNNSQLDIQLAHMAILWFALALFVFPLKNYVKYKRKNKHGLSDK